MPVQKKPVWQQKLNDLLYEQPTMYLLGAGASVCAGLPLLAEISKKMWRHLPEPSRTLYRELAEKLVPGESAQEASNVEDVLSEIDHRLGQHSISAEERHRYEAALNAATTCIHRWTERPKTIDHHRQFVQALCRRTERTQRRQCPPVRIATTNYDLLLERACEQESLRWTNGFCGLFERYWHPEVFEQPPLRSNGSKWEPSTRHVTLLKLHGSLSWWQDGTGKLVEHARKPRKSLECKAVLIYPSRGKYAVTLKPPFEGLIRKFQGTLSQARVLVTIGYGFGDEHINEAIKSWVRGNSVKLIFFGRSCPEFLLYFGDQPSLSAISKDRVVWEGRECGESSDLWDFPRLAQWLAHGNGG